MECKIDGCEAKVRYKSQGVCQKHYFRFMRNGSYELKKQKDADGFYRVKHSAGYISIMCKEHPLAQKWGGLYEHRKVMYDKYGENLPPCQFCGATSDWKSRSTHIDHIDNNRSNNLIENLRVLCNPCNSRRDRKPDHEYSHVVAITIDGVTRTAWQWAAQDGVRFCGASILRRYKKGMSGYESVYGSKMTHNGGIK